MKSWYQIRAQNGAADSHSASAEVLIYDEIGAYGVTAKGFLAELGALRNDAAIDLRLNSPGGSVFDAVAIYNALKRHAGDVTVWIDGIAASAASYIAMAGDLVIMPENAFLMIHDPSGLVAGTAEDMRATAEALDKVQGSLAQGYAAKSGKPEDEIASLMAAETWLDAHEALELGFIDRIAEPVKLAASFDVARFRNAPAQVIEAAKAPDDAAPPGAQSEGGPNKHSPPDPEHAAAQVPSLACDVASVSRASDIRAEAIAHARAVIDLCHLAGEPQMAGTFLSAGNSMEEIRAALLERRAEAASDISTMHAQPGRGASSPSWGDVIARTFRTKG
jgi:ATP-dependent Clp endopeptidase proteolytic subunit ClpP